MFTARSMDDIVQFLKIWFNNGPNKRDPYMAPVPFRDDIYCYRVGQPAQDVKV